MAGFKTIEDLDIAGQTVLLRVDFNVPMADGQVTDRTRIERAMPTIRALCDRGARVVLLSHLGRPKGVASEALSLRPLIEPLSDCLGATVAFAPDCIGDPAETVVRALADGQVALLENLRFHTGEEANEESFARGLAALGGLYVNDAFSAAHRAHASVEALAHLLPAAAGRLMQEELQHLGAALDDPARPLAAFVGGAKISTKLDLLGNLVRKVDMLAIGGGMANTFLNALGVDIGQSLCEHEMAETAREIVARAKQSGCDVILPTDAVVAPDPKAAAEARSVSIKELPEGQVILDIGPQTAEHLARRLEACRTLVWNGPLGLFEIEPFDRGTSQVAQAAARLTAAGSLLSVAGGGDTVAALAKAGALDQFSYVSTAGGAFLEWLEGKTLPGVAALMAKS